MSTPNTKAIKSIIPAEQIRAAFKAVVDEPADTAGRILADALWKDGKGESAATDIGAGRVAVNVMPGLGDAVVAAKVGEDGRHTYDVMLIHPAMGNSAELWTGAASLAEVEEILVTIGHG
jgi:hypothetical protein